MTIGDPVLLLPQMALQLLEVMRDKVQAASAALPRDRVLR